MSSREFFWRCGVEKQVLWLDVTMNEIPVA
jgi:hypothetical protein